MAVITLAGEQLIAQKQKAKQPLIISEFVLAYVPDLNNSVTPSRAQALPPDNNIVFRHAPTRSAYVNDNEVVYSLILDNTVGNFQFNWLGLLSEEGVLISANHMVVQSKRKNNPSIHEEGNNLTRNFLLKFSGAKAITQLTVTPETWQFNYEMELREMRLLLAQNSVGLITNQRHLVEQQGENLRIDTLHRELENKFEKALSQLSDTAAQLDERVSRMNEQRSAMDIIFLTALLKSQQSVIVQEGELMQLTQLVRQKGAEH
ncbi:phage tail protein [Vibrio sp. AND4]|uniref:phage tail-collar fiber domain-containing protein n=1 Tax=Vibrio sp. AND4 TaxID=314289 RepID=UPI00015EFEBA|nr:phage tail protein [Vibrio sp. AND4]EDP59433.1 hypothetical protein AND4_09677 [Vibrio sp. AND4]